MNQIAEDVSNRYSIAEAVKDTSNKPLGEKPTDNLETKLTPVSNSTDSLDSTDSSDSSDSEATLGKSQTLDYALLEKEAEQMMAENFYKAQSTGYASDYQSEASPFAQEQPETQFRQSDTDNETLKDVEEVEEHVKDYNMAASTGNWENISFRQREKVALWASLNKAELNFRHTINGLTSEIDYSKVY